MRMDLCASILLLSELEFNFKKILHLDLFGVVDNKLIIIQGVPFGIDNACIFTLPPGDQDTIRSEIKIDKSNKIGKKKSWFYISIKPFITEYQNCSNPKEEAFGSTFNSLPSNKKF